MFGDPLASLEPLFFAFVDPAHLLLSYDALLLLEVLLLGLHFTEPLLDAAFPFSEHLA